MHDSDARNRLRTAVEQWHTTLADLRAEGKRVTGESRRRHVAHLQELQTAIAEEIRKWNARIDTYDMDPTATTQREFDEQMLRLHDAESQLKAEVALWLSESHDVG